MDSHSLPQGIFLTQGSNPSPALQADSLLSESPEKPLLNTNSCRLYFREMLKKIKYQCWSLTVRPGLATKTWILRTRISSPGHQCPVGLCHRKIKRMKKVGLRGSVSHQTGRDAVCRNASLARQRLVATGGGAGVLEQTGLGES